MRSYELGEVVLDTSVLVDLLAGTERGRKVAELIKHKKIRPVTTELNITELRYILCRKIGWEKSEEIINKLLFSGYFQVLSISNYSHRAALLKCQRSLSLVDCFTIAVGEMRRIKVMYAKKEKELENEISKKPFTTEFIFPDELPELT